MHVPNAIVAPYIGTIQTDWLIIGLLLVILVATAVKWGTARACVVAVTMPVSAFLFSLINDSIGTSAIVSHFNAPFTQSLEFIGIIVFVYIMTHRMYRSYSGDGEGLWLAFLAGLATSFVVLVVWIHTPALGIIWEFSSQTKNVFGTNYAFWWMIISLFTLGYVRS